VLRPRSALPALVLLAALPAAGQPWPSALVADGPDGRLAYVSDAEGNRVPDFSDAGYRGGGGPLPDVPAVEAVRPSGGDDTAAIQAALDRAAARAPSASGHRGAVRLAEGAFEVRGTLRVGASGVVLRGAGPGATTLRRTGRSAEPVVRVGSPDVRLDAEVAGTRVAVTSDLVPIGARVVRVEDASGFAAGDAVVLRHPSSPAWLDAVDGGGTDTDAPWAPGEVDIAYARTVVAVDGDVVTLDAPAFHPLRRLLSVSTLARRDTAGVVREVGVEGLRVEIGTEGPEAETHAWNAVEVRGAEDAWVRDVEAVHFVHAGLSVRDSRRVTAERVAALDPHSRPEGGRRYNLEVERAQLVLFRDCRARGARHAFVGNGGALDSGIVFLRSTSEDATAASEPHRRWGHGFLFNGHTETGGARDQPLLALWNRGSWGTGHGWAAAHSVVWNARMNGGAVVVQKPPTAQNYAVGVDGLVLGTGAFPGDPGWIEGTGRPGLQPASLYDRQRADRLGGATRDADAPEAADALWVGPNPAAGPVRLRARLAAPAEARLDVVDALGRAVWSRPWAEAAGSVEAVLDAGALAPGVYVCRLAVRRGGSVGSLSRTFVVVR
jgi:hypothetical protein